MGEPIFTDKDYLESAFDSLHKRFDDFDNRYHRAVFDPQHGLNARVTHVEAEQRTHRRIAAAAWGLVIGLGGFIFKN